MNLSAMRNWVEADMSRFVVFILSHGRASRVSTYRSLERCGYTGRVIIVCDNEDASLGEYLDTFGKENVYVFDKPASATRMDSMTNSGKRNAILFARNVCFDIANELGYDYFVELDDDYKYFSYKFDKGLITKRLDDVMRIFVEFLLNVPDNVKTIAFSQEGEHLGGWKGDYYKRKSMNSFFCLNDRRFEFIGLLNEDVNAYTLSGSRGDVFLTYMPFSLKQENTQQRSGGITELYKDLGTYAKSFFTVMAMPSCVKIRPLQSKFERLHHHVRWNWCVPKIISEQYKKKN